MPTPYSWTERIVTTDAGGAPVSDLTAVHTITWADTDAAAFNSGRVATELAIAAGLDSINKAYADYQAHANVTAGLAVTAAAAKTQAEQASAVWELTKQQDADVNAAAIAKALMPLLAPAAPGPKIITGPGQGAIDSAGSLLTMDAQGACYRDGARLKNSDGTFTAVSRLIVAGKNLYGVGKTVPNLYRWTGLAWLGPITDGDPALTA